MGLEQGHRLQRGGQAPPAENQVLLRRHGHPLPISGTAVEAGQLHCPAPGSTEGALHCDLCEWYPLEHSLNSGASQDLRKDVVPVQLS